MKISAENKQLTIISIIIIAIILITCNKAIYEQNKLKYDFKTFYFSSIVFNQSQNIYDLKNYEQFLKEYIYIYPYIYTPFLAQVFSLFTKFNCYNFQLIFTIFSILSIILSFIILIKLFKIDNKLLEIKFIHYLYIIILLVIIPFRYVIILGQIDIIVLMLIVLSLYLDKRNHKFTSGLILAAAVLTKYYIILFIFYFVFQKKYKLIISFLISLILMIFISFLISPNQWLNFISLLQKSSNFAINGMPELELISNNSLVSVLYIIFKHNILITKLVSITSLIIVIFIIFQQFKNDNFKDDNLLILLQILLVVVFSSPYTWRQHIVYLLPGVFSLIIYLLNKNKNYTQILKFSSWLIPIIILISLNFTELIKKIIPNNQIYKLPLFSAIILFVISIVIINKNLLKSDRE
jgi:hypothetical protein